MRYLFIFFFSILIMHSYSQKISGAIKDEAGIPVPASTAFLYKAADSALVKMSVSNSLGVYEFISIKPGNYFVKISNVAFKNKYSQKFAYNGNELTVPEIFVSKSIGSLTNVVVAANKPVIEVKADKIIFNVENNITVNGLDGLELLRQSPGVLVDQEDNISIAGKSSVQIYIDGKPSPLTAKDLSSYLRSLRSSSIESIEIINNPSAKYEAAGTGGIINIKLTKNKSYGTNGNIKYDFQQGIWGKHNAGVSLNHRNKNINIFSNYNFNKGINEFDLDVYRSILDTVFDSYSATISRFTSHNIKAGADYFINKKNTIGILLNGNFSKDSTMGNNISYILYAPTKTPDRTLISDNRINSSRNTVSINLNYRYSDSSGHELNMDADYSYFTLRSNQYQPNIFYDPLQQNILYENNYSMITPSDIDLYSFKADYEQNLKKGRLGFGGKIAFINSDNLFNFYNHDGNNKLWYDSVLSNHFIYRENINALYVNYNKSYKNLQVQLGMRMENTITKGKSIGFTKEGNGNFKNYDEIFTRRLIDFFPSGAITFTKNPKSQWTISYSRRINRPSYQDLNPFEKRGSEYGGFKGNPSLRPEYANTYSLINVFHSKLVTNLSYSHTKDVIVSISDTLNGTKSFYSPKNLATQDNISLSINYSWSKKWYSLAVGLTGYYTHNLANFGVGRTIDLNVYALRGYIQNNFTLGKGWTASVSSFYNSPSLFRGTMKTRSLTGVNAGFQKNIFKGNGNVRLNFNDVFNTLHWYGTSNFAGQYLNARVYWDPRNITLGFSYKFGSSQVKSARQRRSGLDEESKRANDNSNNTQ
ncbi:MAG: outer membrane beta-barrel family protein [Ginsengibacter sp.]